MANWLTPWHIRRPADPPQHAFFISHVAEDSRSVRRLKNEIAAISGRGSVAKIARDLVDFYEQELQRRTGN